jgi:hypothetical protein
MNYCVTTSNCGLQLKPNRKWAGKPKFKFIILGTSDSDNAKDTDTRQSMSNSAVFLEGSLVV